LKLLYFQIIYETQKVKYYKSNSCKNNQKYANVVNLDQKVIYF